MNYYRNQQSWGTPQVSPISAYYHDGDSEEELDDLFYDGDSDLEEEFMNVRDLWMGGLSIL